MQADVSRRVPAPDLAEVAAIRWDVDGIPDVTWNADGTAYDLVHPTEPGSSLALLRLRTVPEDPAAVARALATTLAACDFPPTVDHAAPGRVAAALRAARLDHLDHDDAGRGPA